MDGQEVVDGDARLLRLVVEARQLPGIEVVEVEGGS